MNTTAFPLNGNTGDYINTTAIFGEVKRNIISKDFKGGRISNFFGETSIDFTNADISGVVVLDIIQACGEIKLTVPPHWQVSTDITQFFAETRDKRAAVSGPRNADKVLVITGNSVFAEVKIKNAL